VEEGWEVFRRHRLWGRRYHTHGMHDGLDEAGVSGHPVEVEDHHSLSVQWAERASREVVLYLCRLVPERNGRLDLALGKEEGELELRLAEQPLSALLDQTREKIRTMESLKDQQAEGLTKSSHGSKPQSHSIVFEGQ